MDMIHTYPFNMIIFLICVIIYVSLILLLTGRKGRLTPLSVRQGLDNMSSGICFADESGKIILINRVMGNLASTLFGRYPYSISEFYSAINPINDNNLYKFPDNSVWNIITIPLSDPGLAGYSQVLAKNVTDIIAANENLRRENNALKETNEKLNEMYIRLADRIRNEETLKLKVRIHDDIGAGLIALSSLIESGKDQDIERELILLKDAVSYFGVHTDSSGRDLISNLKNEAQRLGVILEISGDVPTEDTAGSASLLSSMMMREIFDHAIRECMTNCVTHALGDHVYVNISDKAVTITNNGAPPNVPITEGSGLSSLRRNVEAAGKTMEIHSTPVFKLIIWL